MAVCPSCKSTRIRNDYKPAPIWLRVLGIRALLCDHCNRQFRAFQLRAPRGGRPRSVKRMRGAEAEVELNSLRRSVAEAQNEKVESLDRVTLSLHPERSAETVREVAGEVVTGPGLPASRDIRTQVLRLHAQGENVMVERPLVPAVPAPAESNGLPRCSACDSKNVRRRRRTTLERATLTLANLKAFNCRDCGASFYAKYEEPAGKRALLGSSAISAEPKG